MLRKIFKSVNAKLLESEAESLQLAKIRHDKALVEAETAYLGQIFNPWAELYDARAKAYWSPVGSYFDNGGYVEESLYESEDGRSMMRATCKRLSIENPYAINVVENMINYIVGCNLSVEAVPADDDDELSPEDLDAFDSVIREFEEENNMGYTDYRKSSTHCDKGTWEQVRRMLRDGEIIMRSFTDDDKPLQVRFVEPWQVANKDPKVDGGTETYGIVHKQGDAQTYVSYRVDGDLVPAEQILHIKFNVDRNVKRGIPFLWAARMHLIRACKLLENVSTVAQYQAAIGAVRYHNKPVLGSVGAFADRNATTTFTNPMTGQEERVKRVTAGQIIDLPDTVKMDFPSTGVDVGRIVQAQQAELRAAASRMVLPEFMLSSDASNGNYASTVVTEGPPYKMFRRLQSAVIQYNAYIIFRALQHAVRRGLIQQELVDRIKVKITGPEIINRDPLQDAQAKAILFDKAILSAQTWSAQVGLDYKAEQRNIDEHALQSGPLPDMPGDDADEAVGAPANGYTT